jgi:beta-N-acetylhexosaminidase
MLDGGAEGETAIPGRMPPAPAAAREAAASVGQLLMVDFAGPEPDRAIEQLIADDGLGGVILFAKNIENAAQVARLTNALQRIAASAGRPPLLVAVDQEGGPVVRLREAAFPSAMAFAAAGDGTLVDRAAQATARALRLAGIHMNCAPVLDVNSNPANPVIGVRSYGEDPEAVARLGVRAIGAMQRAGVLAVAKHFPGHGDTIHDSHLALPTVAHPRTRLEAVELAPFRAAVRGGVAAVMTAHVLYPALDPQWPATLSPGILDLLRRDLGFGGLVVSDSMRMRAIADHHRPGAAAVQAVRAGVDLVLALGEGEAQRDAVAALRAAVERGEIPAGRLQASLERLRVARRRLGLFETVFVREDEAEARIRAAVPQDLALRTAEAAATLVTDPLGTIPLPPGRVLVAPGAAAPGTVERLAAALCARGRTAVVREPGADEPAAACLVVPIAEEAATLDRALGPLPSPDRIAEVTRRARRRGPVVAVACTVPYVLAHVAPGCAGLAVYGADEPSLHAAARVLTGELRPRGRLPVTVPGA